MRTNQFDYMYRRPVRKIVPWTRTTYNGSRFPGERNDCAVRAAMTVSGKTYKEAHAWAERLGRRPRRGTPTHRIYSSMMTGRLLGVKISKVPHIHPSKKQTIGVFLRENPTGTFFCQMRAHVFAVIDGKCIDTWGVPLGSRIVNAWVVGTYKKKEKPAKKKTAKKVVKRVGVKKKATKAMARRTRVKNKLVKKLTRDGIRFVQQTPTQLMRLIDGDVKVYGDIMWLCANDKSFIRCDVAGTKRKHFIIK